MHRVKTVEMDARKRCGERKPGLTLETEFIEELRIIEAILTRNQLTRRDNFFHLGPCSDDAE